MRETEAVTETKTETEKETEAVREWNQRAPEIDGRDKGHRKAKEVLIPAQSLIEGNRRRWSGKFHCSWVRGSVTIVIETTKERRR